MESELKDMTETAFLSNLLWESEGLGFNPALVFTYWTDYFWASYPLLQSEDLKFQVTEEPSTPNFCIPSCPSHLWAMGYTGLRRLLRGSFTVQGMEGVGAGREVVCSVYRVLSVSSLVDTSPASLLASTRAALQR